MKKLKSKIQEQSLLLVKPMALPELLGMCFAPPCASPYLGKAHGIGLYPTHFEEFSLAAVNSEFIIWEFHGTLKFSNDTHWVSCQKIVKCLPFARKQAFLLFKTPCPLPRRNSTG
jgi:hypothetical protein